MRTVATFLVTLMFVFSAGVMVGCEEQGPAERTGERIDESFEDAERSVGESLEEAGDEIEDASDEL